MLSSVLVPALALASSTFAPLTAAQTTAATNADYIVVGGGTGGCALAARLCMGLPGASVTLLERGKERDSEEVCLEACKVLVCRSDTTSCNPWRWLSLQGGMLRDVPVSK